MRKQQRWIFKDPYKVRAYKCTSCRADKNNEPLIGTDLINSMFTQPGIIPVTQKVRKGFANKMHGNG